MPTTIELIGTALFAVAVIHTFATSYFEHLAHIQPAHAGLWHLLGEVEVVFGFWAFVFVAIFAIRVQGSSAEGGRARGPRRGVLALCLRIDEDWTVCCESADIRTALRTRC